jgi:hypothetical protein
VSILVLDHGYPLHLAPHLSRYLVHWVFNKRRDKDGKIQLRPVRRAGGDDATRRPTTHEGEFREKWQKLGLAPHHIQAMYREHFPNGPPRSGISQGMTPEVIPTPATTPGGFSGRP